MTPEQSDLIEQLRDELGRTNEDLDRILENLTDLDFSNWESATVSEASLLIAELTRMKYQKEDNT